MKTLGISPKAVLAAVVPTLGGVIAVGVQWLVTGELDRAELGTAIVAVAAALLAFLGAYAGAPGRVSVGVTPLQTYVGGTLTAATTTVGSNVQWAPTGSLVLHAPASAPGRPGEFDAEPAPPPEAELRDLHENDET